MITYCEKEEADRTKFLLSKSKKIKKQKAEESEETARRMQKKLKRAGPGKKDGSVFEREHQSPLSSLASGVSSGVSSLGLGGTLAQDCFLSEKRIEFEPFVNIDFFPSNLQDIVKTNAVKNSEKIVGKISKLKTPSLGAFPNRIKKMRYLVEAQEEILERCLMALQSKPGFKALDSYNQMKSKLINNMPVLPSSKRGLEGNTEVQSTKSSVSTASSVASDEKSPQQVKSVGDITIEIEEKSFEINAKHAKGSCLKSNCDEEYYVVSPAKTEASLNDCCSSQELFRDDNNDGKRMNIIDRLLMNPITKTASVPLGVLNLERKISESLSTNRKRILSSSKVEDITDLLTEVISKSEEEDSLGMEEHNDIWNYREEDACSSDSLSEVQPPLSNFQYISCHYYTPQQPLQNFYNQANNLIATYAKTYDFDSFMLDHDLPQHNCF